MHDETDETIARIVDALRPLPDVDPAEKARVLVAVAAERERIREQRVRVARRWKVSGAIGAMAAAVLVAALWLNASRADGPSTAVATSLAAPAVPPAPASVDARLARDARGLKAVQVVLRAPDAQRVSVVGDFNGWDSEVDVMTRDPASGLWSHTLTLRPGRHVYAFVVDDSVWMRDPRSPEAADEDFGRPGSVLLVGQP